MKYSSYKKGGGFALDVVNAVMDNVVYPDATIREYLNMKRVTKDKGCLIVFLLYCMALIIMMGIGFFYGNYRAFGVFVNDAAALADRTECAAFVSQDFLTCQSTCASGQAFLGKVCLTTSATSYKPAFSAQVDGLISIYNLKYTLPMITYTTFGLLVATVILFALIIYFPKITYFYIACLFLLLLSMSFFLLKNVESRINRLGLTSASQFYWDEQRMRVISFLLLGIYLLIFPFILFSPKKIQQATAIIAGLKQYFSAMISMNLITLLIVVVTWGSLILEIFLLINFYAAGSISKVPQQSMFYTYTGVKLSHPASLTFHFIGVYWLYATIISWHKYFTSSAMCLWYFQESEGLYPVKRGFKRSLHHLGTAAVDAILMPVSWLLLLVYSMMKMDSGQQEEQEEKEEGGCMTGIRRAISNRYKSINRNSPSSAVLTNLNFFQSCQMATEMFALNRHRFFNIGGTLTIFLTLFVCMLWVIITFFIMYSEIYTKSFPAPISSIVLPIFAVFVVGLVIGSLFANIFTAALDALLFCYLLERKNMVEGADMERAKNQLAIKQVLDNLYFRAEEEINGDVVYVYESYNENTLDMTYITKKE